jgi:hypothetical protein
MITHLVFYNNTKKEYIYSEIQWKKLWKKFMIEIFKYMCQKSSIMDTKAEKLRYKIEIVLI